MARVNLLGTLIQRSILAIITNFMKDNLKITKSRVTIKQIIILMLFLKRIRTYEIFLMALNIVEIG